ncbi:4Fe-4S ferredoxin [Spirochaetia bacterium]|nr:4Fe-4S ferredoxin [Spirochaetia bacterium]
MANIIFYFTGTGNSLKIARMVSNKIGNCEIFSIGSNQGITINKEYESIGFIYPVYYWGVPKCVKDFISSMTITNNEKTYVYAIASYGGFKGDGIKILNKLMLDNGIKLNYGKTIRLFSNYIINFNVPNDIKKRLDKCDKKLESIIDSIQHKKTNSTGKPNGIVGKFYNKFIETVSQQDKYFNINSDCIGCGVCKEVCPVNNIEIVSNKPEFQHHCEQCLACLQFCPKHAINYNDKTQGKK